ncbi:hypothetical protein D6C86_07389 [Aureobasidium pullulans]|uniref:Uncharacterized protein n=1 Tax=Aureobasidium pullulans TaxID=5580 RepID=A0A4S9WXZ5_AURPU|nr:hypothetical protein D6C99_04175 [Aureobasidium pullulans]THY74098.1 hypothetical protein D6C94_05181 [Aureobasidium pullulans]THZ41404.1 hypothetical protein D6C87_05746 [Aureobasidium pullulans]THZ57036.1 hypothetical protein D6C86_07389 [Aureobasidium pullulans]THZ71098.1 hypothetical protein D6C88_07505 [Aureobasidium pullulans]
MDHQGEKASALATVKNFRDISSLINTVKPGYIFRSAHIDDASLKDLDALREQYRIRSIIDLRGMQPWPMISTVLLPGKQDTDFALQYPEKIAHTSILGLNNHYIDLCGPQFGRFVLSQTGLWERTKGLAHIAISPATGIKSWQKLTSAKMSKDRMFTPKAIIDHSFPQVKAVFKILANPSSYPILILNKWGSEMVSLIVSMTMLLLHVDRQSIYLDYAQTYQASSGVRQQRLEELRASCYPDDWAEPLPDYVNALEQHLETKHGGIEQYLLTLGLSRSEVQSIKAILLSGSRLSEKNGWLIDV